MTECAYSVPPHSLGVQESANVKVLTKHHHQKSGSDFAI